MSIKLNIIAGCSVLIDIGKSCWKTQSCPNSSKIIKSVCPSSCGIGNLVFYLCTHNMFWIHCWYPMMVLIEESLGLIYYK